MKEQLAASLDRVDTPQDIWDQAAEIQEALTEQAQHRSASIPDLIVAATARARGLEILHYDRDFDTIARYTEQAARWIVPPGTVLPPPPLHASTTPRFHPRHARAPGRCPPRLSRLPRESRTPAPQPGSAALPAAVTTTMEHRCCPAGCCRMPGSRSLVGAVDGRGRLLTPKVGRTCLEDDRFRSSVEIIFATIRFCNSPPGDNDVPSLSLNPGARVARRDQGLTRTVRRATQQPRVRPGLANRLSAGRR